MVERMLSSQLYRPYDARTTLQRASSFTLQDSAERSKLLGVSDVAVAPPMRRSSSAPNSASSSWLNASASASASNFLSPSTEPARSAPRITVLTPMHKRTRSETSLEDISSHDVEPYSGKQTVKVRPEDIVLGSSSTRNRLLVKPSRARSSTSSVMKSIAEETSPLRVSSSFETIRNSSTSARNPEQHNFTQYSSCFPYTSPALSQDSSATDWHDFVSANYGQHHRRRLQAVGDTRRSRHTSHTLRTTLADANADSPTLKDQASWLEEELAECSTDEESNADASDFYDNVNSQVSKTSTIDDDEKFVTPQASPMLPLDELSPWLETPDAPLVGLGSERALLQSPQDISGRSTDSLLEQVKMHEACVDAVHKLSRSGDAAYSLDSARSTAAARVESDLLELPSPPKPRRRSSLLSAPSRQILLRTLSNGEFASIRSSAGSSNLFMSGDNACYDPSRSPGADSGHCDSSTHSMLGARARKAPAANRLSSGSTTSTAEGSIASHGSSLLFDGLQISVPMATRTSGRPESVDTGYSTRPSSATSSSFYCSDRRNSSASASSHSIRSPVRKNTKPPLSLLVQNDADMEADNTRAAERSDSGHASIEGRPPSKASERVLRQAKNRRLRKEGLGIEPPRLPMRLDSLESLVSAAPKHMQSKAEFPERLLGDWMMRAIPTSPTFDSPQSSASVSAGARPVLASTSSMRSLPSSKSRALANASVLDRFRRSTVSISNSDRKSIMAAASRAEAEWHHHTGASSSTVTWTSPAKNVRPRGLTAAATQDGVKELKSRSSFNFLRKLQTSAFGSDDAKKTDISTGSSLSPYSETNFSRSASTFGRGSQDSRSRTSEQTLRHLEANRGGIPGQDQSYFALSEDEDVSCSQVGRPRFSGKKDLRKIFGTCDEELNLARARAYDRRSGERDTS